MSEGGSITIDQSLSSAEPVEVVAHEDFKHDCSGFPEGFERQPLFVSGREYTVPADIADYFIRAGWCALPGEEPVKPDKDKPVLLQPDSATVGQKAAGSEVNRG